MNATTLLKKQHKEVTALLTKIKRTKDRAKKQALVRELADDFLSHTAIEEQLFYPVAYATETRLKLNEAIEEHDAAKRVIGDLLTMPADHPSFAGKIELFQEQIEHHIAEEEAELFKHARKVAEKTELEQLGYEMEQLFETQKSLHPGEALIAEVEEQPAPME